VTSNLGRKNVVIRRHRRVVPRAIRQVGRPVVRPVVRPGLVVRHPANRTRRNCRSPGKVEREKIIRKQLAIRETEIRSIMVKNVPDRKIAEV
jgi:hypothetical protein